MGQFKISGHFHFERIGDRPLLFPTSGALSSGVAHMQDNKRGVLMACEGIIIGELVMNHGDIGFACLGSKPSSSSSRIKGAALAKKWR